MKVLQKVLLSFLFFAISWMFAYSIDFYIFPKIGSVTFSFFGKYLMTQFTLLDIILIRWFPILIILLLLRQKNFNTKAILKFYSKISFSLIVSLLLGIILALFFWTTGDEISVFFPSYATFQPFANYWTIFISLGIVFPIVVNVLKENKKLKHKL